MTKVSQKKEVRSLNVIANEIRKDWLNVNFGAKPYLNAMACMNDVNQQFGGDKGKSIVLYFLSNTNTWRGETAKRIKKELNLMVK